MRNNSISIPFNLTNNKYSSKNKIIYMRIILVTSLIWVLIDTYILLYLLSNTSNKSPELSNSEINSANLITHKIEIKDIVTTTTLKQETTKEIIFNGKNEKKIIFLNQTDYFVDDFSNEQTNPINWYGENGQAVKVPDNLKEEEKIRFKENQFNIVASDLVALNRTVPDQRKQGCRIKRYPVDLPTTSIVIVFHNEGNSTLLRGLTSIVRNSSPKYLKEIILVDDASEAREYLHDELDAFLRTLSVKTKIFRNKERKGLIRSRLIGAAAAEGETMTFLDAHIEVTKGWLPPLLNEVKINRKTVACPVIDVISDENIQYLTGSDMTMGGFDENFGFNWYKISERIDIQRNYDQSAPFRSPTMAGGLFTINRDYFYELGSYDEGMDVWGAENIEMSLRIWMCGGTLLITPCSHVGHIFRKQSPYTFPGGARNIIARNTRRFIDVWADEYKLFFYRTIPDLKKTEVGDLSKRFELKANLKCKSFKWYLKNIYPEAPIPVEFYHLGEIKNDELNFCIDTLNQIKPSKPGSYYCHGLDGTNQLIEYSKLHHLSNRGFCFDLDMSQLPASVKFAYCNSEKLSQKWIYDKETKIFQNQQTHGCLTINKLNTNVLNVIDCDAQNHLQKWILSKPLFSSEMN